METQPIAPATPSESPRVPGWWWAIVAVYMACMFWLALRTRVFMDQVWIIENGRQLLGPETRNTMFMLADGSSDPPVSWLGPLFAELAFRSTGSLTSFRMVAALAMVVLATCWIQLAQRLGVNRNIAILAGVALLFDGSMTQSAILGRADTLALAVLMAGMALATSGASRISANAPGLLRIGVGYALCALAPGIWTTAALMGPLALLHWSFTAHSLQMHLRAARVQSFMAFVLIPLTVLLVSVGLPYMAFLLATRTDFANYLLPHGDISSVDFAIQVLSPSVVLVIAGFFSLLAWRKRWLALAFSITVAGLFVTGFYPFRVPYLLIYLCAAISLYSVQLGTSIQARAWSRLMTVAAATAMLLMAIRVALAFANEPPPEPAKAWLRETPESLVVADFSWDFYVAARRLDRTTVRSFPRMNDAGMSSWLSVTKPDLVIRPIVPAQSWMLVEELDAVLSAGGYCLLASIDWQGRPVKDGNPVRPIPTPMLWRLGMFRSHGPYALWGRCPAGSPFNPEVSGGKPGMRLAPSA